MRVNTLLTLCLAALSAVFTYADNRIIGGSATSIENYPEIATLLFSWSNNDDFQQECGSSILNQRSIMTAAHCVVMFNIPARWRFRVGSTYANSGGVLHNIAQIIIHPEFNYRAIDIDVAIIQTTTFIAYNNAVQPARIAGPNYIVPDNDEVWAAGWGVTEHSGRPEELHHVQIWTISQAICRQRYAAEAITDNMLCAGWLDVGGRSQCYGDSGGPLYHHHVVVGITSFGYICADAWYPGVNARVSRFSAWVQANA